MARIRKMGLGVEGGTAEVVGALTRILEAAGWTRDGDGPGRLRLSVSEIPGRGLLVELGDHDATTLAQQLARLTGCRVRLHRVVVGEPLEGGGHAWTHTSTDFAPDGSRRGGPQLDHTDLDEPFGGDPHETADAALWVSAVDEMPGDGRTQQWTHAVPDAPIHADTWTFAPSSGVRLELGGTPLTDEESRYLAWRLDDLLDRDTAAPDLDRWMSRLLRRHDLDRIPARDEAPAYWADVMRRTEPERSRTSDKQIPAWKLEAEGDWFLVPEELDLASRKLGIVPSGHTPSPDQAALLERVGALLDAGETLVIRVRQGPIAAHASTS